MLAAASGVAVEVTNTEGPPQPMKLHLFVSRLQDQSSQYKSLWSCQLQNLPSACVAHVLQAQPNDVVLDMCAAPGNKTWHVAVRTSTAKIVACDKSRSKVESMRRKRFFSGSNVAVVHLDTTHCVLPEPDHTCDNTTITIKDQTYGCTGKNIWRNYFIWGTILYQVSRPAPLNGFCWIHPAVLLAYDPN